MRTLFISILLISFNAFGHSGRTNAAGCHNDNINGGYHCHNGGSSSYSSSSSSSSYSVSQPANRASKVTQTPSQNTVQWTTTKNSNQVVNFDGEIWIVQDSGDAYLVTFLTNKMSNGYRCNERSQSLSCNADINVDGRIFYNQKKYYWNEDLAAIKLTTPILNAMKRGYRVRVSESIGLNSISSSLIGFTKAYNRAFGR
ncbi:YHYH domain-containing protein [Vibrio vulnificus]|uniref:YHYH domain-containing protein n=1 Tax=Vibrio vulnificus TaxID=672 RepID=UPI0031338D54